jgi:hypothetical protein
LRENADLGASVAPVVEEWAQECFPTASKTTEAELRELLIEAAEAARQEYDAASAVEWAKGYTFPTEYMNPVVPKGGTTGFPGDGTQAS